MSSPELHHSCDSYICAWFLYLLDPDLDVTFWYDLGLPEQTYWVITGLRLALMPVSRCDCDPDFPGSTSRHFTGETTAPADLLPSLPPSLPFFVEQPALGSPCHVLFFGGTMACFTMICVYIFYST